MAADSRHGVILKPTMAARPTAMESFAQARQTFHGLLPTAAQAPTECIAARQYVVAVAVAAAVDKNISLDALALRDDILKVDPAATLTLARTASSITHAASA